MNPFRKRSKSTSASDRKARRNPNGRANLSGAPQIISTVDLAFSLPSDNAFRTSLLMPKMADRFSLLRLDNPSENNKQANQAHEHQNHHVGMHTRDLSVLEEGDEEDEALPVRPWDRHEGSGNKGMTEGMSKDEFIRVRAQEGNSLFSGKQRTFKFRTEDGHGIFRLSNQACSRI
jgi:hypothetical protein